MIIVPADQLQPDTLNALIEEFATRDGAVHGHTDTPLPRQIAAVQRQLESGEAVIVFDEETETVTIMGSNELSAGEAAQPGDAPERRIVTDDDQSEQE